MWNPRIKNLIKMVADLRQENYNRLQSIELLTARVEALEAAQHPQMDKMDRLIAEDRLADAAQQQPQLDQSLAPPIGVKPQWLADWLADEERLGDLEAAIKRRKDRGGSVPLDWLTEACEIRDRQKERRKDLGLRGKVNLIAQVEEHGQQPTPIVDTGWQNMADGSPIMEPAPPAPAEGLVERVAWRLANQNKDANPEIWRSDARAAIREVARWLQVGRLLHAAELLEQEAER